MPEKRKPTASERPADNALSALVSDSRWILFCKAMETGNVSAAQASSLGLRWRLARINKGAELIYQFKVTRDGLEPGEDDA